MGTWFKPEYCSYKKLDCDKCENYKDQICVLTEVHRRLLEDVVKRTNKGVDKQDVLC